VNSTLTFGPAFDDWLRDKILRLLAITQAMCTSFKKELLSATHNFLAAGGHSFKMALYTSAASLDAATTAYTTSNEVTGTGYTAGGQALTNIDPASGGTTGFTTFTTPVQWTTATITARGAMIYNATQGNKAVAILDFGQDYTSTAGTFTVNLPAADQTNAILRIA